MNRTVIWGVNGVLFFVCCALIASGINKVVAHVFAPDATALPPADSPQNVERRAASNHSAILDRNLFNASVLGGLVVDADDHEDYAETKLALTLLGTAAHADATLSWAAVEDHDQRGDHLVVREGEGLKSATVERIERRRIVLRNRGRLEELRLADGEEVATVRRPRARRTARRVPPRGRDGARNRSAAVRRLGDNRFAVSRDDVEAAMANPGDLFSQARILPKYENGEMVGVQLNSIKEGSIFKSIGIQNGDVIKELNGIQITSQQDNAEVLRELATSEDFEVKVVRADGSEATLTYELE